MSSPWRGIQGKLTRVGLEKLRKNCLSAGRSLLHRLVMDWLSQGSADDARVGEGVVMICRFSPFLSKPLVYPAVSV